MFEQTVTGLIKALRASKGDENRVIERALDEIRKEIKSKDLEVKADALLKLVYIEMLGHSIAFASFAIVECMSSSKYHIKSIGYLAASQCFDQETEVAVLVVNLVKKDLLSPPTPLFSSSPSSLTVAHLLSTLSAVSLLLTPSLARDLAPDLLSMLTHSRPQVRKQTMLVMWRVVRSWPGVVEMGRGSITPEGETVDDPWIERLRERLGDEDVGVVSATVNLICELVRKDATPYLSLAPELFGLLTGSTNNWMLIKIIKLFAVLTPLEPRLVKKLVPPLTELITTTPAMSLLYECIQTSIVGGMLNGREGDALARTCVEKLKGFLEDADQNLRYIALVALVKILPTHPHLVATHDEAIMSCIDDPDISIRMRALDLVEGMVDRRSLQPIVERLMTHLRPRQNSTSAATSAAALLRAHQQPNAPPPPKVVILSASYRTALAALILRICSAGVYANVSNFEWYIDHLVELSYISLLLAQDPLSPTVGISLGVKLRDQFIDVTARVKAIRPYAARKMANLLEDEDFLENGDGAEVSEVLGAASWICGEYCRELADPRPVIASLFGTNTLPPRILALYFHSGLKIYAFWLDSLASNWSEDDLDQITSVTAVLEDQLSSSSKSTDLELQERSAELLQLLKLVRKGLTAPRPVAAIPQAENGFGSNSTDPYDQSGFGGPVPSLVPTAPLPPSCLHILSPLFFSYELNSVNPKAQSMVVVPEGLDLDQIIVPLSTKQREGANGIAEEAVDDYGRPLHPRLVAVNEEDRGDGKVRGKGKTSTKKGKRREVVEVDEDPEELARLKAERLERQREDPYYIGSSAGPARKAQLEDVDSIPIVQLSLDLAQPLPGRAPSAPTPPPRLPTPPPVHIDVEGEMPETLARPILPSITAALSRDTPSPGTEDSEAGGENVAMEGVVKVVKKKRKEGSSKKKKALEA